MGTYKDLLTYLMKSLNDGTFQSQAEIARIGGVQPMYVNRLINGDRSNNIQIFLKFIDSIGGKLVFPDRQPQNHFARFKTFSSDDLLDFVCENYRAIPLVSKQDFETNINSEYELKSDNWVLVSNKDRSIKHRSNLVSVKVDSQEDRSMVPTLHPGDLALLDRSDFLPKPPPGNIYLVRIPAGEGTACLTIKRVRIQQKEENELIVFYSDSSEYGPDVYDLNSDFGGDIRKAIIGRVVWSWADMTQK